MAVNLSGMLVDFICSDISLVGLSASSGFTLNEHESIKMLYRLHCFCLVAAMRFLKWKKMQRGPKSAASYLTEAVLRLLYQVMSQVKQEAGAVGVRAAGRWAVPGDDIAD